MISTSSFLIFPPRWYTFSRKKCELLRNLHGSLIRNHLTTFLRQQEILQRKQTIPPFGTLLTNPRYTATKIICSYFVIQDTSIRGTSSLWPLLVLIHVFRTKVANLCLSRPSSIRNPLVPPRTPSLRVCGWLRVSGRDETGPSWVTVESPHRIFFFDSGLPYNLTGSPFDLSEACPTENLRLALVCQPPDHRTH